MHTDKDLFDDDGLDEAVAAADDTGLVRGEQIITEAEIQSELEEESRDLPR